PRNLTCAEECRSENLLAAALRRCRCRCQRLSVSRQRDAPPDPSRELADALRLARHPLGEPGGRRGLHFSAGCRRGWSKCDRDAESFFKASHKASSRFKLFVLIFFPSCSTREIRSFCPPQSWVCF